MLSGPMRSSAHARDRQIIGPLANFSCKPLRVVIIHWPDCSIVAGLGDLQSSHLAGFWPLGDELDYRIVSGQGAHNRRPIVSADPGLEPHMLRRAMPDKGTPRAGRSLSTWRIRKQVTAVSSICTVGFPECYLARLADVIVPVCVCGTASGRRPHRDSAAPCISAPRSAGTSSISSQK